MWGPLLSILALAGASLLPIFIGDHFFVFFLTTFFIFAMLTLGLQLIIGYGGVISLCHAAFFGIGAYASSIFTKSLGISFALALPMAGAVAALGGLLMSPIIRLRDAYFAMASFAFGIVASEVFTHWKPVTGGHDGLSMIPVAQFGPLALETPSRFYYLALGLVVAQYLLFRRLLSSPFGHALDAMRQNEAGGKAAGLHLTALKVQAILLGAATAGVAGSLHAHFNGSVSPQMFLWSQSVTLLTMVVVGGLQSLPGAVTATFLLLFLSEYLRGLDQYKVLMNGLILALFMIFLPRGIAGAARGLRQRRMLQSRMFPSPGRVAAESGGPLGEP